MRGKCNKHHGLIFDCYCDSSEEVFTSKTGIIGIGYTTIIAGTRFWIIETNDGVYVTEVSPEAWGWEQLGYVL